MPEETVTAVKPTIHQFHSASVGNPVGYHEPTKMNSTAKMLITNPTAPQKYRKPVGTRRSRSKRSGSARFAKKMSRNSSAVEMHHTIVTPAYRMKKYLYGSLSPNPNTKNTMIVRMLEMIDWSVIAFAGTLFRLTL